MSDQAVIVSTARTGIGRAFKGALNNTHGAAMTGHVIAAAVEKAGVDPAVIEDVIVGCGLPEGATGQNIGRLSAIRAGLPVSACGQTISRFCGSGLMGVAIAAQRLGVLAQAIERHELGTGNRAVRVLLLGAHVDQSPALGEPSVELVPLHAVLAVEQVVVDVAEHVDRVLRRGVLRRGPHPVTNGTEYGRNEAKFLRALFDDGRPRSDPRNRSFPLRQIRRQQHATI
jgi:hypothetical protein